MSDKWISVIYNEKYNKGIQDLFKKVFKRDISEEYYEWKNMKNPAGESILRLAVSDEKVIGHTCLWLSNMNVYGNKILAAQSVDAMVHSDYRRSGVFEKLSIDNINEAQEKGAKLRFNFPNQMAYLASIKRINIKKVCDIPQYLKIIKGFEAASMFTGNKLIQTGAGIAFEILSIFKRRIKCDDKSYKTSTIKQFDERFDKLWEAEKSLYNIAVERTSAYLNWRYINTPCKYYCIEVNKDDKLIGYVVAACEEKESKTGKVLKIGHIADIFCRKEHKDAIKLLLAEAEKTLIKEGVCAISCWMLKQWFYGDMLSRYGYLQFRCPAVLAALIIGEDLKLQEDNIYDSNNWYVTMGDSDYI